MTNSSFCSGFGQHHTNNPEAKTRKPYISINYNEVIALATNPSTVEKGKAQWAIFSTETGEQARQHKHQREHGLFGCLWVDIDEGNKSLSQIQTAMTGLLCNYLIYSSNGSTEPNKKWRVLMPLATICNGELFTSYQEILNDYFENKGIKTDRASQRAGQLCYLPNKGAYYEYIIENNHEGFNTALWQHQLESKQTQKTTTKADLEARQVLSKQNACERLRSHHTSPIDAFNASTPIEDMLLKCGYEQHGDRFLSPNSESGSAGVTVTDGKWFSNHESDSHIGNKDCNGTAFGDATDLWFEYFNHGVNNPSALAAYLHQSTGEDVEHEQLLEEDQIAKPLAPINIKFNGTLGEIQQYCSDLSIYPDESVSGFTALSVFASICGHKYVTPTGLKTNLYCILVMPTGSGKDSQKDAARQLMQRSKLSYRLVNMAASKQALHEELQNKEKGELVRVKKVDIKSTDSLMEKHQGSATTTYIISDEFHDHFIGLDKNNFKMGMRNLLMSIYSETNFVAADVARTFKYLPLTKPHLNILGFSTPSEMLGALGSNASASGFINRFLILTKTQRPTKERERLRHKKPQPSSSLISTLAKISKQNTKKCIEVQWADGGFEMWEKLDEEEIEPLKDDKESAELSGRLGEDVIKIATLFAINENHEVPLVTEENVTEAWSLRKGLHEHFLSSSSELGGIGASGSARLEAEISTSIHGYWSKHNKPMSYTRLKDSCSSFRNATPRDRNDAFTALNQAGSVREISKGKGTSYLWVGKP